MPEKKKKKARPKTVYRNATAALPRAIAVRAPRPRPNSLTEALLQQEAEKEALQHKPETRGRRAVKAAGGALATTIAGAYLARQNWLPPMAASGVLTALGLALAVGADNPTAQSLGLGVMSAAGGQLGFMLIDDELLRQAEQKEKREQKDQGTSAKPPAEPGKRQAADIPADALARAYERARLRMALSSDAN